MISMIESFKFTFQIYANIDRFIKINIFLLKKKIIFHKCQEEK
jgi:hypothetical protein